MERRRLGCVEPEMNGGGPGRAVGIVHGWG